MKELPHYVAWFGSYSGRLPAATAAHTGVIDCGLLERIGRRYAVWLTPAEYYMPTVVEVRQPDGTVHEEAPVSWDALSCETNEAYTWDLGKPRLRITFSCVNGNDIGSIIDHVRVGLGYALAELLKQSGDDDSGPGAEQP